MKKIVLQRALLGMPLGMCISLVISIIISLCIGDGSYCATVPELAERCGSEISAVIVQYALSAVYGAVWAGASCIWEAERWSLTRQTLTHFAVTSVTTFPIAYLTGWMERSLMGIVTYYAIFLGIYAMIWLLQYIPMRKRIAQLNSKVTENCAGE